MMTKWRSMTFKRHKLNIGKNIDWSRNRYKNYEPSTYWSWNTMLLPMLTPGNRRCCEFSCDNAVNLTERHRVSLRYRNRILCNLRQTRISHLRMIHDSYAIDYQWSINQSRSNVQKTTDLQEGLCRKLCCLYLHPCISFAFALVSPVCEDLCYGAQRGFFSIAIYNAFYTYRTHL